jgi:hypothetical protein
MIKNKTSNDAHNKNTTKQSKQQHILAAATLNNTFRTSIDAKTKSGRYITLNALCAFDVITPHTIDSLCATPTIIAT